MLTLKNLLFIKKKEKGSFFQGNHQRMRLVNHYKKMLYNKAKEHLKAQQEGLMGIELSHRKIESSGTLKTEKTQGI